MKNQYRIVIAAATAAVALIATSASAQYRAVGDDGIAASPKVRQMLDERARSAAVSQTSATTSVGYRAVGDDDIAASPRLRQMMAGRPRSTVATPGTAVASATCTHGCCSACGE